MQTDRAVSTAWTYALWFASFLSPQTFPVARPHFTLSLIYSEVMTLSFVSQMQTPFACCVLLCMPLTITLHLRGNL